MKKIITVVALALISSGAFAQFNKGRILAGGNISLSTGDNSTSFSLSPDFGYFVIDNLAVGGSLVLNTSSSTQTIGGTKNTYTTSYFALAPFVRYYLDVGVFFQAQTGFGSTSSKSKTASTTNKTSDGLFLWSLGAGYAWFLNDNVAIEPIISYGSTTVNYDDSSVTVGRFNVGVGFQVYLGPRN